MAQSPEKNVLPAYISFTSLTSVLNNLRENGLTDRIDRSLMPRASGSQISAVLASLRFLKLIDDTGKPSKLMSDLVHATDEKRPAIFEEVIRDSYSFLFADSEFDLERASGQQVIEKFRELGISGSTVTKCISFFLAAAKFTNIKVSSHVKAPPPARANGKKVTKKKDSPPQVASNQAEEEEEEDPETMQFQIPIPGKPSVKVIVPKSLDAEDWSMLSNMLGFYIKRWKGFEEEK